MKLGEFARPRCLKLRLERLSRRLPARIADLQFAQDHAGLGAVARAELLEDHGQVRFHRALLDVELIGDLLVEQAFGR